MKKLLGISLIAALAVSPMMARAEYVTNEGTTSWTAETPTRYNIVDGVDDGTKTAESGINPIPEDGSVPVAEAGKYFKGKTVTETDAKTMATGAYVKGAYNAAISAINKLAADTITADEVMNTIESSAVETTTGILAYQDWDSNDAVVLGEGTLEKQLKNVQLLYPASNGVVADNATPWDQQLTVGAPTTAQAATTSPYNAATQDLTITPPKLNSVASLNTNCVANGGWYGTIGETTQCWTSENCIAPTYSWDGTEKVCSLAQQEP